MGIGGTGARSARIGIIVIMAALGGIAGRAQADGLQPLTFEPIASGVPNVVDIQAPPDGSGRLFFLQQTGQVRIWKPSGTLGTPFLNISSLVSCCGEQGLLGLAFHPSYSSNGFFYVDYTNTDGDTVIARYRRSDANPDLADPASATILLTIDQPYANHNGGQIRFGPDGYLYVAMGDGGSAGDPENRAQNLGTLLGKILRIDVNGSLPYAVPPTNPFVGVAGARPEIWAWGLRNPWRFSFDRSTGDMLIGDVGQGAWEEIDFQPAASHGGENYGWRRMEGPACFNPGSNCNPGNLVLPILSYAHGSGDCSVTGGFRYRGFRSPALFGNYIYADYCTGRIWEGWTSGGGWTAALAVDTNFRITTFGEDPAGELYVADYTGGVVYHIAGPVPPLALAPAAHAADFDGDLQSDVPWRNQASGQVYLWLMDGAGVAGQGGLAAPDPLWGIVGLEDFNGDGRTDALWRQSLTGQVYLWMLNGTSVSGAASVAVVDDLGRRIVGVGDLDGDGRADILWRDATGQVYVWTMDGADIVAETPIATVSDPGWKVAGFADLSGDGHPDVLWRHQSSGQVYLWRMNGAAVAGQSLIATVDPQWQIAALGDFDGDGHADVLWRQPTTGQVYMWRMDGAAVIGQGLVATVSPPWEIAAAGDYDGDGRADILWRQAGTGQVYLWRMAGTAVVGQAALGTVAPVWKIVGP